MSPERDSTEARGFDIYAEQLANGRIVIGLTEGGFRIIRAQTSLQIVDTPIVLCFDMLPTLKDGDS